MCESFIYENIKYINKLETDNSIEKENVVKMNFVALSKFTIANGMEKEVKQAFANRSHLVELTKGFIKMDVISPFDCPSEIWLITYWENEKDYKEWHKSQLYRDSHKNIPKGLKLIPKSSGIKFFKHISS